MDNGEFAYFEGRIVPTEDANINIMTHAFNYGTGVFEGIRAYWNDDNKQLNIFRLDEHIDRMMRSFRVLCIDPGLSFDEIREILVDVTRKNGFKDDVYIRPIGYKSSYELGPKVHGLDDEFAVYVIRLGDYVDISKGLGVTVSSWRRLRDNAIPVRCKINGSYVNSALAATEAKESGFDEAIFLCEDGTVSEGSAMNVFLVQDGNLVTPPCTADILVGITRKTVMQIAREKLGIETASRPVGRTELYTSDEVVFCGTGAQVAPVTQVDRRPVGDGNPGEVTLAIQKLYFDVVQGRIAEYRHWLTPVYES